MPVAPAVTVNQLALLAADHPQPSAVRTSKLPVPPAAGEVEEVVDSENAHPWPWFTVNVRPAIVSVPDRPGPLVDATAILTVPLPFPLPPDVIEIHGALLVALQAQPDGALTETAPVPPPGATDCDSGDIVKVHASPCVTVTVCPATVNVPERAGPAAAATLNDTVPVPFPFAPDAIVIHGWLLDAVHGQPALLVMVATKGPPSAPAATVVGETAYVHPSDCVTLKWIPAIVSVAVRGGPVVGATLNPTVAEPFPLALDVTETQAASDVAVHVQSALDA